MPNVKRTVWLKKVTRTNYMRLQLSEQHEWFEIIKTQNTLSPKVGGYLVEREVESLITRHFTVNIS